MFVMRRAQVEAFQRSAMEDFEDRMIAHLREVFPETCGDATEPELRARVQRAVERAARWGVELEYDICLYLQVTVALGDRFDDDPARASLRAVLADPRRGPSTRVADVHDLAFAEETPAP